MAARRIPAGELLRMACLHAMSDREEFINAYRNCADAPHYAALLAEERAYLKQLRAYYRRRWGKKKPEES